MIQTVKCTNCARSSKDNDDKTAWAEIQLTDNSYCATCRHDHEDKRHIRFCSTQCMILFVQRHADRILKYEQDMINKVPTYTPTYVNPLFDPVPDASLRLNAEEKRLLTLGQSIYAITSLRDRTTLGLKECKDIVDRYLDNKR